MLLAVPLLAAACAGDDETATRTVTVTTATTVTVTETETAATTTTASPGAWDGLDEPLPASGELPVGEFNAYAESVDEAWEREVAATVDEYVGREAGDAPNVTFQATSGPEGGGPTSATLQLEGLLDDSVRSRRYDLTLSRRGDGTWEVVSATWAQRCHEGRGHQAFTPAPCL